MLTLVVMMSRPPGMGTRAHASPAAARDGQIPTSCRAEQFSSAAPNSLPFPTLRCSHAMLTAGYYRPGISGQEAAVRSNHGPTLTRSLSAAHMQACPVQGCKVEQHCHLASRP